MKDLKTQIKKNENEFWNNLSDDQRKALIHLSNDKSITFKPADKGGAIVIMDTETYEMECLKTLSDPNFYEELPSDPYPEYRHTIDGTIDDLLSEEIITDFEAEQMKERTRTPSFYGVPKIHKDFDSFLPLKPICSGFNFCTVKISEFVHVFLKPAAQQNPSYIRDTSHFVHKIENDVAQKTTPNKTFRVTMDVSSLYPNIDHNKGISACEEVLSQRDYPLVQTSVLSNLIRLILQCKTLKFGERFFHQIKGTAIGTPMTVNFTNVFMERLERRMLQDYKRIYGRKPMALLNYIDDILFLWDGNEISLKHFIQFCNRYATNNNMKSNIKFMTHYFKTHVTFLDTKIKFKDGKLVTELYTNPSVPPVPPFSTSTGHQKRLQKNPALISFPTMMVHLLKYSRYGQIYESPICYNLELQTLRFPKKSALPLQRND